MSSEKFSPDIAPGPFHEAFARLAWAEHKVNDLKAAADHFIENCDIALERCPDPDHPSTHEVIQIVLREQVPAFIRLQLSDILHSLRVSLDYLATALTVINGGTPNRYTGFPVGNDMANLVSLLDSKIPGVSQTARAAIVATQPYKGGNDNLFAIHDLNRTDKHLSLVTAATGLAGIEGSFFVGQEFRMATSLIGTLETGLPIASVPIGATFQPKLNVSIAVCLDYAETPPVGPFADAACGAVGSVLRTVMLASL